MRDLKRNADVELNSSQLIYSGAVFDVRLESIRLPSGLPQEVAVVVHSGAVCVAAMREDGKLLLVRQYRHPLAAWTVEIPAGRLEQDEEPLTAAQRELEEETGYRAREWELARRFHPAAGFCSEQLTLFVARGLEEVPGGGLDADPDEELENCWMSPQEILASENGDAKTLLAAMWLTLEGQTSR